MRPLPPNPTRPDTAITLEFSSGKFAGDACPRQGERTRSLNVSRQPVRQALPVKSFGIPGDAAHA